MSQFTMHSMRKSSHRKESSFTEKVKLVSVFNIKVNSNMIIENIATDT